MAAPPDPGTDRLVRADGAVVVPPGIANEVLRALVRDLTTRVRTDGGEVSPGVRQLLWALQDAAQHPARTAPSSAHGTAAPAAATVELTAHEAAALMGCSTEYARRLARTGRVLARRAGPAWLINRQALDAYRRGTAA
ncbi:helix-turn-helix domain-containing protein [Streptomyces sp. Ju416(a)]|uniref:excisionase family DNA-binding protein n=1 Tax=Streptomyces sp. Ju416(a) TaxID=3446591 RepID=UPI00403DF516